MKRATAQKVKPSEHPFKKAKQAKPKEPDPECECTGRVYKREVQKEGSNNRGKHFLSCSGCDSFMWYETWVQKGKEPLKMKKPVCGRKPLEDAKKCSDRFLIVCNDMWKEVGELFNALSEEEGKAFGERLVEMAKQEFYRCEETDEEQQEEGGLSCQLSRWSQHVDD